VNAILGGLARLGLADRQGLAGHVWGREAGTIVSPPGLVPIPEPWTRVVATNSHLLVHNLTRSDFEIATDEMFHLLRGGTITLLLSDHPERTVPGL